MKAVFIYERSNFLNKNYLIYPLKTMRITQTYLGKTSHLPHTQAEKADYPIDEGGSDTGRDYIYCPLDEMVVKRIYGIGSGGTNTIWLESTQKALFADGSEDYCVLMIIHPNDDDLRKISVGQVFTRKEKICREGSDGATANHLHLSVGQGKIKGNGWIKNSNGKWVLAVAGKTMKPENAFYVDETFTKIMNSKGLSFKSLGGEKKEYPLGNYKVTKANVLNVRKAPAVSAQKVLFDEMTENAKKKILKLSGKKTNGYVKGLVFTAFEIKGNWARTPSGWVCLDYCEVH